MSILETIVANKKEELKETIKQVSLEEIKAMATKRITPIAQVNAIVNQPFLITEFKRRSPSNPDINLNAKVEEVVASYENKGASAISVLTDNKFFGGSLEDLQAARACTKLPILRKDFVVSEYQIYESKAHGADIILLIAASLSKEEMQHLYDVASAIGLNVLVEIHEEIELSKIPVGAKIVGINSRDLKTLKTDKKRFYDMISQLPSQVLKVAESAIKSKKEVDELMQIGYGAFLIGESLMSSSFAE